MHKLRGIVCAMRSAGWRRTVTVRGIVRSLTGPAVGWVFGPAGAAGWECGAPVRRWRSGAPADPSGARAGRYERGGSWKCERLGSFPSMCFWSSSSITESGLGFANPCSSGGNGSARERGRASPGRQHHLPPLAAGAESAILVWTDRRESRMADRNG